MAGRKAKGKVEKVVAKKVADKKVEEVEPQAKVESVEEPKAETTEQTIEENKVVESARVDGPGRGQADVEDELRVKEPEPAVEDKVEKPEEDTLAHLQLCHKQYLEERPEMEEYFVSASGVFYPGEGMAKYLKNLIKFKNPYYKA